MMPTWDQDPRQTNSPKKILQLGERYAPIGQI